MDEHKIIWQDPEDESNVFTIGDMLRADEMEKILRHFLANIADGHKPEINELFDQCGEIGISLLECPLCGLFGEHSHYIS